MTAEYEKYFGDGDISKGKARMMQDIEKRRLSGGKLSGLIGDLEAAGLLTAKPFTPKPKELWDRGYLSELSVGFIADYFSRAYLEHFGEVAEYVSPAKAPRKRRIKPSLLLGAVLAALAIGLICRQLSSSANSGLPEAARNDISQSAQASQG